jgi:hypothetical protein
VRRSGKLSEAASDENRAIELAPNEARSYSIRGTVKRAVAFLLANCLCARDCGTGNGQVATELARFFDRVIAIDASEKQILSRRTARAS